VTARRYWSELRPTTTLRVLRIGSARGPPRPWRSGVLPTSRSPICICDRQPFRARPIHVQRHHQPRSNGRLPTSSGRKIANVSRPTAQSNSRQSGGPLLDSAGRLIGVTTAIFIPIGSNAGIGFASRSTSVKPRGPRLDSQRPSADARHRNLSASEADAARLGTEGVIVLRTAPGSPAERAGIRGGRLRLRPNSADIITKRRRQTGSTAVWT